MPARLFVLAIATTVTLGDQNMRLHVTTVNKMVGLGGACAYCLQVIEFLRQEDGLYVSYATWQYSTLYSDSKYAVQAACTIANREGTEYVEFVQPGTPFNLGALSMIFTPGSAQHSYVQGIISAPRCAEFG